MEFAYWIQDFLKDCQDDLLDIIKNPKLNESDEMVACLKRVAKTIIPAILIDSIQSRFTLTAKERMNLTPFKALNLKREVRISFDKSV